MTATCDAKMEVIDCILHDCENEYYYDCDLLLFTAHTIIIQKKPPQAKLICNNLLPGGVIQGII